MTTFDSREEAFEKAFAHDQDLLFKAKAERNRRLASWAAERMQLPATDAAAYVEAILSAGLREGNDEALKSRIRADLETAGQPVSDHQLTLRMTQLLAEAKEHIQTA